MEVIKPKKWQQDKLKEFLDGRVTHFNKPSFIAEDPISIPHHFTGKQDIEIAGFFAAIFAWGNRRTIINKSKELMARMDNSPYSFVTGHTPADLKNLLGFRHRTFHETDLLYFVEFLRHHYADYDSLENAFTRSMQYRDDIESGLNGFHDYFFSLEDVPARTLKHIASPARKSTCKRLNMLLRWMVRKDGNGVDFGLWPGIPPSILICPVDVHVARVARRFGLLHRKQADWKAALELTANLRRLDPADPVKYDFALFGLGALEKF